MRVKDLSARLYRIPPPIRIQDSIQRVAHWEWIVTTVTTDSGLRGTGFAYTGGLGGTAIRELVETYLAPLVRGQDPRDIERVWTRCWWELHSLGSGGLTRYALATVDVALWDILAQQAGVPLYRLLGGARDRIRAYGSGINMHLDGEPLLDQMRGFLDQRLPGGQDEDRAGQPGGGRRARGRGPRARRPRGPRHARRQPEVDGGRGRPAGADADALRARSGWRSRCWPTTASPTAASGRARAFPLAAGETMYTRYEFADFMRAGALDVVQADIVRVGGFTEWLKIAKLAESFNLPVAPHFVMELSIHALCAVPNGLILEDLQGGSLTDLGLLAEPIRVERGEMAPPARPGHGIVLDEAALRRYEVTGRPTDVAPTRS